MGIGLVFFVLSQAVLLGLVALFRALTVYDDAEEILGENMACAISYAGVVVALALVVGRTTEGTFSNWKDSLLDFAKVFLYVPALYLVRQVGVVGLVLGERPTARGGYLDIAIGRDRNVGLAAIEAATYVGTALAIVHLAGILG